MSILVSADMRVIIQGITGREGRFHAQQMLNYGTQVVGGVTPGKGGEWTGSKPVFDTVESAIEATGATVSAIFVPAAAAVDAIYEAVDAGISLIICITEGIPIHDMMKVRDYVRRQKSRLLGPNCPGILVPGQINIGIMPGNISIPGTVGVVSRSGTLTYEVIDALTTYGLGQSACIGIGGDPILGTTFVDVLEMFEADPGTDSVALLGEIGGRDEIEAAEYIKTHMTKPVAAYIAGKDAPEGRRMGHAGAIIAGHEGTAEAKIKALHLAGVRIAENPENIPKLLKKS